MSEVRGLAERLALSIGLLLERLVSPPSALARPAAAGPALLTGSAKIRVSTW